MNELGFLRVKYLVQEVQIVRFMINHTTLSTFIVDDSDRLFWYGLVEL